MDKIEKKKTLGYIGEMFSSCTPWSRSLATSQMYQYLKFCIRPFDEHRLSFLTITVVLVKLAIEGVGKVPDSDSSLFIYNAYLYNHI